MSIKMVQNSSESVRAMLSQKAKLEARQSPPSNALHTAKASNDRPDPNQAQQSAQKGDARRLDVQA
ncbi:MAG: hypothetical protein H7832_10540 [Magnetococcus sp. DMHC-6]